MKLKNLTRRKAVIILIAAAVILAAAVFLCGPKVGLWQSGGCIDVSNEEGRREYLLSLGWEVDESYEEHSEITLPESFEGAISDYAAMQTEQGYDFCSYCGKSCEKYTYIVTNHPSDEAAVFAVLFVKGSTVIGGDIHSAEIGGFMHGIK